MMTRTRWIVVGSAVLLGILAVANWFMTHKRVTREVREPPSGEARQNPYLALERTLARAGLETTTETSMSEPNADRSVLFLVDELRDLSPKQLSTWREWVRNGGHLVVTAPPAGRTVDPLLEEFGFFHSDEGSEETEGDGKESGGKRSGEEGDEMEADDETEDASVDGPGFTQTGPQYEVSGQTEPLTGWRTRAVDWNAFDQNGDRLAVSRPVGAGRVTAVASANPFRNSQLDKDEHARFAWELLTIGAAETSTATIVRFVSPRSWIGHVAGTLWPGLVAIVLALLFALNAGRWNFGPELPTTDGERRSRTEHIRATGEFLWQHDAASELVASTRQSLLEALRNRRPSLEDASPEERRRIVGDELDLSDEELEKLFDDGNLQSREQFETRIDLIERYRRTL